MTGNKEVPERRPKHRDPDLEKLLTDAEDRDWRVMKGSKYYKCYCPCDEEHMKTVHLTPSGGRYAMNTRKWFERQGCWKEER